MTYDRETAAEDWRKVPVDEVGYYDSATLLAMSDDELRAMTAEFEASRYALDGWRNWNNLWRSTLGLDDTQGKHVLDFGCGFGIEALQFARAGNEVTLVDINPSNVGLARRVVEIHGYKPTYTALAFLDHPFFDLIACDVFYANGVLHHTPDIRAILQRAVLCLRPGGEIRLMLYSDRARAEVDDDEDFAAHMDDTGTYASWWDERAIVGMCGDFLRIARLDYITPTGRYLTCTLVPR